MTANSARTDHPGTVRAPMSGVCRGHRRALPAVSARSPASRATGSCQVRSSTPPPCSCSRRSRRSSSIVRSASRSRVVRSRTSRAGSTSTATTRWPAVAPRQREGRGLVVQERGEDEDDRPGRQPRRPDALERRAGRASSARSRAAPAPGGARRRAGAATRRDSPRSSNPTRSPAAEYAPTPATTRPPARGRARRPRAAGRHATSRPRCRSGRPARRPRGERLRRRSRWSDGRTTRPRAPLAPWRRQSMRRSRSPGWNTSMSRNSPPSPGRVEVCWPVSPSRRAGSGRLRSGYTARPHDPLDDGLVARAADPGRVRADGPGRDRRDPLRPGVHDGHLPGHAGRRCPG